MSDTFTLGHLAQRLTGGNLQAMARLLNDAGHTPRLDEDAPDPAAPVAQETVVLSAFRAADRVSRQLIALLNEKTPPGTNP